MHKGNRNLEVRDLSLFENYLILLHEPTQSLYAFPKEEHHNLLRENGVSSLSSISESEIECYPLTSDRMDVENYTVSLPIDAIKQVGCTYRNSNPSLVTFFLIN